MTTAARYKAARLDLAEELETWADSHAGERGALTDLRREIEKFMQVAEALHEELAAQARKERGESQ